MLAGAVRRLRAKRQRVVLTNGCFDVLHVGHVSLLERAKRLGQVLIVAINSDRSVRAIKGPTRPIVCEQDRARVLAALGCVDYVTIFDEPTPLAVIAALLPDVLVKGADWSAGDIVGGELVRKAGGRVARIPLVRDRSTTTIIDRIARSAASRGGL